ncbi:MAG: hypothetical protein O6952_06815 [Planctomycetota bacterium]|nr:hypothetical protein [Planctomycetota bacterium]
MNPLLLFIPAAALQVVTETEEAIRLPGAPEPWVLAVIAAIVIAGVILAYRSETKAVSPLVKAGLGTLRVLVFAVALVIFFQIVLAVERTERRDGQVLVLVDGSLSMSFRDKYADSDHASALARAVGAPGSVEELSRIDLVRRILLKDDAAFLRDLSRRNAVRLYMFDSRPRQLLALEKGAMSGESEEVMQRIRAAVDELVADGAETAIGDSLNQALRDQRGRLMAGIVLFSDGQSNSGTFGLDRVAKRLSGKGGLYAVGVGNPANPRDIALSNLQASEVVLVGDQVPFDFQLGSIGFDASVEVQLLVDGKIESSESIRVEGSNFRRGVRLEYKPMAAGEYDVTIRTPVRPGELLEENNVLVHRLKVIDEKIRVLYVENFPRWEYRFLKTALIRDQTMKVNCLLLSADDRFPQESSPGIPAIGSFPIEKEDLYKYHVVIIGDVPSQSFTEDQQLLIRSFVEDIGGGLLMISGEGGAPDSYVGTPIEALLPVTLPDDRASSIWRAMELHTEPFHPKLTVDGRMSPILRLLDDPDQNRELIENRDGRSSNSLPGLYWTARVGDAKPGAKVLAEREGPSGNSPLLALQYYGAGRTFFSATDETWRWRSGVGDKFFYRFWGQVIRFLAGGRIHGGKRVEITTDKSEYTINDQVSIAARVYDQEFKPETSEEQILRILRPGDEDAGTLEIIAIPGQPGRYSGSFVADRIGRYQIWMDRPEEGSEARAGEVTFTVIVPPLEYKNPKLAEEELIRAAEFAKGKYYDLTGAARLPDAVAEIQQVKRVPEEAPKDLWDRWWMLLLFTSLITVEWVVRKLVNLV